MIGNGRVFSTYKKLELRQCMNCHHQDHAAIFKSQRHHVLKHQLDCICQPVIIFKLNSLSRCIYMILTYDNLSTGSHGNQQLLELPPDIKRRRRRGLAIDSGQQPPPAAEQKSLKRQQHQPAAAAVPQTAIHNLFLRRRSSHDRYHL